MAKQITRRTLLGYTSGKFNAHAFDDLITQMKDKQTQLIKKIKTPSFWNKGGNEMKFNAIVGNPPYQQLTGGAQAQAVPLYNLFVNASKAINPDFISLIMPARWYTGGFGLNTFRDQMLHDNRLKELHDFVNATECFSNVEIKGGICYFLWSSNYSGTCKVCSHKMVKLFLSLIDH